MAGLSLLTRRAKLFAAMLTARAFHIRRPFIAHLLLTYKCNMRCRYCFVDGTQKRDELTNSQWLALIDELASRGTRQIYLMGGEPLIHPFFDDIVERIKSHGMICDVVTNGLLVPRKIRVLEKLDSLVV